jgi:hypothetical protein
MQRAAHVNRVDASLVRLDRAGTISEQVFFSVPAVVGAGWIREMYRDAPMVTANAEEAWRWATRDEALAVSAALNQQDSPGEGPGRAGADGFAQIRGAPTDLGRAPD